jgi:hypothetical protein
VEVLNTTFNNISDIWWRSVLLLEETVITYACVVFDYKLLKFQNLIADKQPCKYKPCIAVVE